jgi:hypothetical protein
VRFVYHAVPNEMVGELIYPLNELASAAPEIYEKQRAKYLGREAVLDAVISAEGLLFNDTVHCAPLHPYRLFAARDAFGFASPPAAPTKWGHPAHTRLRFYEIPLDRLSDRRVSWYRWETNLRSWDQRGSLPQGLDRLRMEPLAHRLASPRREVRQPASRGRTD